MTPQEEVGAQLLRQLLRDTVARWEQSPPVALKVSPLDVYALIVACQTAISHPAMPPYLAQGLENVGRQFQEAICDTPELYAITEAGWNRAFDVDPEATP